MSFGPRDYSVPPFTIDELIGKLQQSRKVLGGDAPVLMVDQEPVCECICHPERVDSSGMVWGACVYLSDRCEGIDE